MTETIVAVRAVIVIVVIGIVLMDYPAAVLAGCVVVVVAAITERHAHGACVVVAPDAFAAVRADNG